MAMRPKWATVGVALGLGLGLAGGGLAPGAIVALNFEGNSYRLGAGSSGTSAISALSGYSFTRAHTGTMGSAYVKTKTGVLKAVAANVPRVSDLGFLCEKAATNLVTQNVTLSTWSGNPITTNAILAPDGTLTGAKIVDQAAGAGSTTQGSFFQFTAAGATTYAHSIYAKAGERSWLYFRQYDGTNNAGAWFDLATGTIGTIEAGVTASIEAMANGWYRCVIVFTTIAGAVVERCQCTMATANSSTAYVGDGVSGLYVWGGQVELGSLATSVILTGAGSGTRAADMLTFSGLTLGSTYSIIMRANVPATTGCDFVVIGADANNLQGLYNSGGVHAFVQVAGVIQANVNTLIPTPNVTFTVAGRYALNDVNAAMGATLGTVDTSVAPAAYTALGIGPSVGGGFGGGWPNGYIKSVYIYPTAFNDNQLLNQAA